MQQAKTFPFISLLYIQYLPGSIYVYFTKGTATMRQSVSSSRWNTLRTSPKISDTTNLFLAPLISDVNPTNVGWSSDYYCLE